MFHQELDDSSNEDGHANANVGTRSKDLSPTQSRKLKNCDRKKVEADVSQAQTITSHRTSIIRSRAQALGSNKSILHGLFKDGLLRQHWWSLSEVKLGPFLMYTSFLL